MILRSSPPSPFGRKIKIAAKLLGLYSQITVEQTNTADPEDSVRSQNPLGKIPVLILEDGECIYDSTVILDSMDRMVGGGKLIPTDDTARRRALTLQALADGMMDASILIVYETRMRDEKERSTSWLDYQAEKVTRALTYLETNIPDLEDNIHVGHIALACALGYRDLRFSTDWRDDYPALAKWLETFANKVPAFDETKLDPDA